MRRLTDQERIALREVGPAGEGPVSYDTFDELIRLGYGFWANDPDPDGGKAWCVTDAGRRALELDDLARNE